MRVQNTSNLAKKCIEAALFSSVAFLEGFVPAYFFFSVQWNGWAPMPTPQSAQPHFSPGLPDFSHQGGFPAGNSAEFEAVTSALSFTKVTQVRSSLVRGAPPSKKWKAEVVP